MANQVEIEVPSSLDGERVDKAIAVLLDMSRAEASEIVAAGATVDGSNVGASQRVRGGQIIRCRTPQPAPSLMPQAVDFGVLHEDKRLIVVDKPPGLVVHPGGGKAPSTLAAGLLHRYPELEGVGEKERWGLVHRLDKDTSGTILIARDQEAFEFLTAELRHRRIERTYIALVEGRMGAPTGTIDAPIGRDTHQPTRRAVVSGGKHARTHYEVSRYYEDDDVSLLEVKLETGRTHQIRVHLAAIDHPVAGDITYGATGNGVGSPRTFLHASRLELTHPATGDLLKVEAPLPSDLRPVLESLS